ncbi:MAG TPA: hypothetical protein DEP23_03990 [Ruminococcaceae bacterium]|nr:hypothetical protein [Oscillospiraceae bacterium]
MTKKKMFIIGGSAAFCVLIIALIAVLTGGTPSAADTGTVSQTASDPTTSVTVSAIDQTTSTVSNSTKSGDLNNNIAETEKDTSTPVPPTVKDESQLTNPNSKPSYDSKDTKVNSDSNKPKNGDRKDGKIYVDGFGWIDDEGGTASGQVMGNEGDQLSGNQVGNMG